MYYPTHFERQVQKLQFDWHDTGLETDTETIEKIGRNLGLNSKHQVIDSMARIAELESNKSILGKVNTNDLFSNGGKKKGSNEKGFFCLDATEYRVKRADWLSLVIFEGVISETLKR